jgi:hypothetical protein
VAVSKRGAPLRAALLAATHRYGHDQHHEHDGCGDRDHDDSCSYGQHHHRQKNTDRPTAWVPPPMTARPESAVDEQAVKRSEQRHRAARDAGELNQPMGLGFAALSALELLPGDRAPRFVDHAGRLA